MSACTSSDEDEQLALDMQLALDIQAKEERKVERRRKKQEAKKDIHHSSLEDGFARDKLNADHMLFVKCRVDGRKKIELLVDTGASVSAMSTDMVQILGLQSKLNSNIYGDAKGERQLLHLVPLHSHTTDSSCAHRRGEFSHCRGRRERGLSTRACGVSTLFHGIRRINAVLYFGLGPNATLQMSSGPRWRCIDIWR
jgi:hypothetical protein